MSPTPMPHRDQAFRDQPSLFDSPSGPPLHLGERLGMRTGAEFPAAVPADQGKVSRDETYREVRTDHDAQRQKWLMQIIAAGRRGVTLDELSARSGITASAFSGRITELKDRGLVIRTGERRPTRAGKSAAVIVAKQFFQSEDQSMKATNNLMPDQLTNAGTVRDSEGRPLEPGRRYSIAQKGAGGSCRVHVYEDPENNLCCCRIGSELGQRIDEMDPRVIWTRL